MFSVVKKSLKRVAVLMFCFLLTLGMTSCAWKKSKDKQEEDTAVEVTVNQTAESKKETNDKASADKKEEESDKKNDKKTDNAGKKTDKKDSDKKNTSKSDDKSGKSDGNNNTGGNGGGSYSGNGGTTVVYAEQPKQEQPKTEEPKQEQPKTEEPKTEEPKIEEPKTEEPKTEEPKTEEPKTEQPTTEEPKTEEPTTEEPKPKSNGEKIEFSGNPDDVIVIEENSYCEGEKFVLYLGKGCKVHGDIAIQFATIMDDLEDWYDLKYSDYIFDGDSDWREYYYDGAFQGINTDCSKVNIVLVVDPKTGEVEYASDNMTLLFDDDMNPENDMIYVAYHELTHVLRLRQSKNMGDIFEEGVATYTQYKYAVDNHLPMGSMFVYTRDDGLIHPLDEEAIYADAEQVFRDIENSERSIEQFEYQYGIRFVYFLMEEYGEGVIRDISNAARKDLQEYDNLDQIIKAIKDGTSEDVFERFSAWLPDGWEKFTNDYNDYMSEFEEEYY